METFHTPKDSNPLSRKIIKQHWHRRKVEGSTKEHFSQDWWNRREGFAPWLKISNRIHHQCQSLRRTEASFDRPPIPTYSKELEHSKTCNIIKWIGISYYTFMLFWIDQLSRQLRLPLYFSLDQSYFTFLKKLFYMFNSQVRKYLWFI